MESRLNPLAQHVSKLSQMFDGTSCILHVTKLLDRLAGVISTGWTKTRSLKGLIRTISLVSTNSLTDDVRTAAENSRTSLNAFYLDCMNCSAIDIVFCLGK